MCIGKIMAKFNNFYRNKPNDAGDEIYIYYDIETIEIIANKTNELWFKNSKNYTDKEENSSFRNKFTFILFDDRKRKYDIKFINLFEETLNSYKIVDVQNKYYVLCTSYQRDNNLCWNTFVKNFKNVKKICVSGITNSNYIINNDLMEISGDLKVKLEHPKLNGGCIAFYKNNLECMVEEYFPSIIKRAYVLYDLDEQKKFFYDLMDSIYELYNANNMENLECIKCLFNTLIEIVILFFKNSFYRDEKEVRFVIRKDLINIHKNEKIIYDKVEDAFKLKFDSNLIDHITVTSKELLSLFPNYECMLSRESYNNEGKIDGIKYDIA